MNTLIRLKKTTPVFVIALVLAWFALSPIAQAVVPPPDGGYPGGNTAEGQNALFSLTTGQFNPAVGALSLRSNTFRGFNTGVGAATLFANTGEGNTATGAAALLLNTDGLDNTANGAFALLNNTTGSNNTAIGAEALFDTTGNHNTGLGSHAGSAFTTGSRNTAVGSFALINATGSDNTALGINAGADLTGGGSNNIHIGNPGLSTDDAYIRIGTPTQTKCAIAGIRDVTTAVADAIPVVIDSTYQLGTQSSSRRFKKGIKPMDKASEDILALKPVTFHYKSDKKDTPQFGLIAEEVAAVNPDLVVRDKNGEIYTVRYDAVNAMLLNEFQKEHRELAELKLTVAEQRKGMEAMAAQLKEQASQIQKVSAQLEASKPAPQVVNNP